MSTLEKVYQPQEIEKHWYHTWQEQKNFQPQGNGQPFCIMLPPPNVTGSLHMGHGFGFTLIDILIRYERMSGKKTLWQGGTDHAGIATQMVVERKLNAENQTRHEIGREAFIEKIWQWKQESGDNIKRQLGRLGASIDWSRDRFTLDDELSNAVREVFIQLYKEGLIYRGKRLVNWDPVLLTAISDLEVNNHEEEGKLYFIRYPVVEKENIFITVATTRPETLLGDVAVAVHPEDARYQTFIGLHFRLPLTDKILPIIADEYVDPEMGTGCVKITPAHDFNDYAVGMRHKLEPINILTPTAKLNENVPKKYQGLDRFVAREKIIQDLSAENLIEKIDKHLHKIPRGDRSNAVIEPYLTYQWYVKSKELAEPAIAAVEEGKIKFIPENWQKTYFQWMHNIEDWCISRQLWWGHRIPVWYDDHQNIYVGRDEANVRRQYKLADDIKLKQDEDVLDTWFSSALWPFSSLGWPNKTEELSTFFPTSVLITGFDIIFFWVARMIMMSLKFTKHIPFREVYITGLIRDAEGQKMSKTKGNVLDPIDLIDGISLADLIEKRTYGLMQPAMAEKIKKATSKDFPQGIPSFGTDAVRFTFCSLASYTREIRFDLNRLTGYRNFCNKLWNASRYVLMNCEQQVVRAPSSKKELSLANRWILSLLQKTIADVQRAYREFRFDWLAQTLYDFTWNEFCDWYVEFCKPLLLNSSHIEAETTRYTLLLVLENILRLLHPIMPFITEEIWQKVSPLLGIKEKSIMLAHYPQANAEYEDAQSEQEILFLKNIIIAIRTIRSEMNIAPGKLLPIFLRTSSADEQKQVNENSHLLLSLGRIEKISWLGHDENPPPSATGLAGNAEIFIPLAQLINPAEEKNRLEKEISKIEKDILFIDNKLQNAKFIERAPAEVVKKEQEKKLELAMMLKKLKLQLENVKEV